MGVKSSGIFGAKAYRGAPDRASSNFKAEALTTKNGAQLGIQTRFDLVAQLDANEVVAAQAVRTSLS